MLIGSIEGELIFMAETTVLTWIIRGSGFVLIALSDPYVLREIALRPKPELFRAS